MSRAHKPVPVEPRWEDRRDPYAELLAYIRDVPSRMGNGYPPIPASVAARLAQREAFFHELRKRLNDERSAE